MALLSDAAQKRISAHLVRSERSTGVANAGTSLANALGVIDFELNEEGVNVNSRARIFVLSKPPSAAIIPDPQIGDIVLGYIVDDARTDNPCGFAMYVYTRTVNAAGVVSGAPSWRVVNMT
jgi:hypothetical protein